MTAVYNDSQLAEKDSADILKILSISFEYMLLEIALKHCELFGYNSVRQFNATNRLAWPALVAYPFFVSLANGNSKSLYALFGPFLAMNNYGPVSTSVFELLDNDKDSMFPRHFSQFVNPKQESGNNTRLINDQKTFTQIRQELQEELLELRGNAYLFRDVLIESDYIQQESLEFGIKNVPLYAAIESSIKIIQKQSGSTFFDGDPRTIAHQSTFYEVLNSSSKNDTVFQIKYSDVAAPKLRAFYSEKFAY